MSLPHRSIRPRRMAFTLVELLVVIGIIALLIGILLPALSRARDQAATVACESGVRQFYNVWCLYANDYKGYVLPATEQGPNVEYDFCSGGILGPELGRVPGLLGSTSGTQTNMGDAIVTKLLLTCPAADHSLDPNTGAETATGATQGYWGDYIYNYQMGCFKYDSSANIGWVYYEQQRITRVPGNVIIMMESRKPNFSTVVQTNFANGNDYKPYYTSWIDLFDSTNPSHNTAAGLPFVRIGTPHQRRTKMNVLFADGHVATVNPLKDFFSNPTNQATVKEYLWDAAINPGQEGPPSVAPQYQTTPTYVNGGWMPGVPPGF